MSSQPIGIFDSGVGGLTVLQHIHTLLPNEHLVYFADSKHAPYGGKTEKQIRNRVFAISKFLLTYGCKALVIACNTATAHAAQSLREKYAFLDIPIIGMEPAVKPAAAASKNGIIGVLATVGTLQSAQFAALLEHYGRDVKVVTQGCVGLVECIERGEIDTPGTHALLERYLQPLLDEGADTIVLGCTHYPFLRTRIQQIVGKEIVLIDTGAAVAKRLQSQMEARSLLNPSAQQGEIKFLTNSQERNAMDIMQALWQSRITLPARATLA